MWHFGKGLLLSKLNEYKKIGLGGGCHWCTEGVFSSLKGVNIVKQGWIKSDEKNDSFSEAVIVHYDEREITLELIVEIHLKTHSSTANHSMRSKYRSAVYIFDENDQLDVERYIQEFSSNNDQNIITKVLPFVAFRLNDEEFLDYYNKNKEKPFCKRYIDPKIENIKEHYGSKIIVS
ncbi:MAG: peptide-methionine (S)-S-oxide reductase [Patiriisocius sp.]|jgi:peptide-methionine (S)-S-oxide reductase